MTEWQDRSQVRAAYLNPAFITALIAAACRGYNGLEHLPPHAAAWPRSGCFRL